MLEGFSVKLCS